MMPTLIFDRRAWKLHVQPGLWTFPAYSGHGVGLNNPAAESIEALGPIPAGKWHIGEFEKLPHLGPCVARLTPYAGVTTFGRTGFFLHGDNAARDHTASDGCIIADLAGRAYIRDQVFDTILVV